MEANFCRILEEIAGINPRVLGEKSIARAVRQRMSACNLEDEEEYFERVRSSSKEAEVLIETVVVPETSFFRDKGPFAYLSRHIHEERGRVRASGPLRILSAPCASGEEPYSIAIVLKEAGLLPDAYQIDALDISRTLLAKAERASYTSHSFRGVPEPMRDRYFVSNGRERLLKDSIRHGIRFIHGNLLDKRVLAGKRPYDIMFCRNLLIYFGAKARTRLLNTIERLLAQNGLLFVGHAEAACIPASIFKPLDPRGCFGFRKAGTGAAALEIASVTSRAVAHNPVSVQVKPEDYREAKHSLPPTPDVPKSMDSFQTAQQLADQGRLQEAADICERLLMADRANADTYCLLGSVQQGLGNLRRAEECFSRAIYLDAHSYDAIVNLSLIKEYRGDLAGAEVLRRRAARIRVRAETS
jgi:chemotaxis protein methyltransferase WspC